MHELICCMIYASMSSSGLSPPIPLPLPHAPTYPHLPSSTYHLASGVAVFSEFLFVRGAGPFLVSLTQRAPFLFLFLVFLFTKEEFTDNKVETSCRGSSPGLVGGQLLCSAPVFLTRTETVLTGVGLGEGIGPPNQGPTTKSRGVGSQDSGLSLTIPCLSSSAACHFFLCVCFYISKIITAVNQFIGSLLSTSY